MKIQLKQKKNTLIVLNAPQKIYISENIDRETYNRGIMKKEYVESLGMFVC